MLIRQTAQKLGVVKYILLWNSQRETYNLWRANPITKCFRNRHEDKAKPERTSIRYGMKLCRHSTWNRHGMPTHPRSVPEDPNLLVCTTSMCAVYVPLPCSNFRLYILIGTGTVPLSTDKLHSSVSRLSTQASTPTERLAWQAITNFPRYNYAPGNTQAMSKLDKSTLFVRNRNCWYFQI